jgi:hypothetical protein
MEEDTASIFVVESEKSEKWYGYKEGEGWERGSECTNEVQQE